MKGILDALYTVIKVRGNQKEEELYRNLKREYRREVTLEKKISVTRKLESSENRIQAVWNLLKRETNAKKNDRLH